ncbi:MULTISPECIES: PqqD family peptide modification chaperone [Halomonas]|uniref:Coenzyme PQQ synthesis protein D (PqqD) n=1 Tax=Halomonas ventosae TaxID=229007 RepID=A0A4R6I5B5_9GAMM|nr:PqqD family peptide modification chaperone [Halomonas ventosae]TDO16654.1 coenzyme PQQ synthesis protein D (PqqD) [Halomonas ventosae]
MLVKYDDTVQRNPHILTAEVDDEVVMMSADQGQYFGLSAVGVDIWNLAERPIQVSEVIGRLCQDYDVSIEKCEADTLPFLNEMIAAGLMEIVE